MKPKDLSGATIQTGREGRRRPMSFPRIIMLGFFLIILGGNLLLCLPFSSSSGQWTNPLDAGFTAVSATCVTGLTTLDTATHWSFFGHCVILLLIQLGGLGFMTLAILFAILLRRAVTPRERMLVAAAYNLNDFNNVTGLVKRILFGTFGIEALGAVALSFRFIPDFGWKQGIFKSIFHSVSAFCNAGFDTVGTGNDAITSMEYYREDPLINLTLIVLILLGGIGFLVWSDLAGCILKRRRLSVYSRFILLLSAILVVGGAVLFAVFEWNNPDTLGGFGSVPSKLIASLFQSVTWRTAGFYTIPNGSFLPQTLLCGVLFMFVGGASGSTAGGVKIGTVGIFAWTVICHAFGRKQTVIYRRTISESSFVRAATVISLQIAMILVGILVLLLAVPGLGATETLYEVVSAISTVGVTAGVTSSANVLGKILLMLLMYLGRIGTVTVTYSMMNRADRDSGIRYPDAGMPIG